jgi:hypothetical protein
MVTAAEAQRILNRLSDRLTRSEDLAHQYAEVTLEVARRNAASKPSPQSRMAAAVMGVTGSQILPTAGGPPAEVGGGSEWGSSIYRQFAPRNQRGYWLFPAAQSSEAEDAGDTVLQRLIDSVVPGF